MPNGALEGKREISLGLSMLRRRERSAGILAAARAIRLGVTELPAVPGQTAGPRLVVRADADKTWTGSHHSLMAASIRDKDLSWRPVPYPP